MQSSFKPKRPPKPAKVLDTFTPRARQALRCSRALSAIGVQPPVPTRSPSRGMVELMGILTGAASTPPPTLPKIKGRKRQDIRDSARGEECQVRIIGVCRGGTEHTIWSHAPLGAAGKGRGIKSLDVAGAYCCTACDAALDQAQRPAGMTREQVMLDWFHGHMRSLVILARKGLL